MLNPRRGPTPVEASSIKQALWIGLPVAHHIASTLGLVKTRDLPMLQPGTA
jgi:hypothetical protein